MPQSILVVDSEAVSRDLLVHALQNRLGYHTFAVASVQQALPHLHKEHPVRPDLMLLDWPKSDAAIIADLRSVCAQIPVVALVRYGDYNAAMTALASGAQDFLTKPVAMERMSTTFRNLILLRDARREVERLRRERMQDAGLLHSPQEAGANILYHFPLIGEDGNIRRMVEIEAESIRFAMQFYHGRMTEIARRLGIGRSTLYRKLGEIGIGKQVEAA